MNGHDQVAIVTGGTRGIGAAITRLLAADGMHVVAVFAKDDEAARRLAEELADDGASISVHRGDVGDRGFCFGLVREVLSLHGRVDHLVNNAGFLVENKARDMTPQEWDEALRVNLTGPFNLAQAVLAPMTERRFGRIVNVGSVTATMGNPMEAGYAAAKAGLLGLTRSLARSAARKGVTVNLVVPGVFETDMTNAMDSADQETIRSMIPLGRRGDPAELAHAVRFLLDERAAYITGSVITVDGGLSMGA
ncbi:SDR family oxidoreductase [Actinomadura sp. LD22]|uniref:SDR family oxidoreductase n=1 Tax=Actinomadura physcomitrii TaxID=2650748 RepID=A0A6I4M9I5_9ACTN|nr:3-oxoacyl-ACP reductase FabG [Actinomadura physcomitrii]MWA00894.1 SDR family oxidoreductase [Actinomadura physcomitrii]